MGVEREEAARDEGAPGGEARPRGGGASAGEGGAASQALAELGRVVPGLGWLLAVAGRSPAFQDRLAEADEEVEERLRRSGGPATLRVTYGYRIRNLVDDNGQEG